MKGSRMIWSLVGAALAVACAAEKSKKTQDQEQTCADPKALENYQKQIQDLLSSQKESTRIIKELRKDLSDKQNELAQSNLDATAKEKQLREELKISKDTVKQCKDSVSGLENSQNQLKSSEGKVVQERDSLAKRVKELEKEIQANSKNSKPSASGNSASELHVAKKKIAELEQTIQANDKIKNKLSEDLKLLEEKIKVLKERDFYEALSASFDSIVTFSKTSFLKAEEFSKPYIIKGLKFAQKSVKPIKKKAKELYLVVEGKIVHLYDLHARKHVDPVKNQILVVFLPYHEKYTPILIQNAIKAFEKTKTLASHGVIYGKKSLKMINEQIEKRYPAHAPVIKKLLNAFLIILFGFLCLHLMIHVLHFTFGVISAIISSFCYVFCCGCCCSRSKASTKTKAPSLAPTASQKKSNLRKGTGKKNN